jgi:flavin-dependent dehydrogenase
MNDTQQHCDVLIMGGGPAGSAAAALLAKKGFNTVVLEKDHHPRFHIGESLLPLSLPYLEKLGVLDAVDQIGLKKYAAEFHSVYHEKSTTFAFGESLRGDYPYAYEVRRSEFDHLLLENARAKGATVHEGWRVDALECHDRTLYSISARNDQGSRKTFSARFYIDATGRDTFMADALNLKERNKRHKSAAMYAHYQGAQRSQGQEEGNICVYWFDFGWFWMIPLRDGTMSVGAVCRPDYLKQRVIPLGDFMDQTIALNPLVSKRLEGAQRMGEVTATGNYSYRSSEMSGSNYLLIGDAYAFIDPVFSSGVHLALNSAFKAADVIEAALAQPHQADTLIKSFEREIDRGLGVFSWFIYRITSPAIRDLFMHPRNIFKVKGAVISVLAGDLFRDTRLGPSLWAFRAIYYIKSWLMRHGFVPLISR